MNEDAEATLARGLNLSTVYTWDGLRATDLEVAQVDFRIDREGLHVEVSAPFHGDEKPPWPIGPLDRLWEYEVVELFLLAADGRYLEIEMGPHGHYLVLLMKGVRDLDKLIRGLVCTTRIRGNCWQGELHLPPEHLPGRMTHVNAYAVHGAGAGRRYLAAFPVPGTRPDFHQLQYFKAISELSDFSNRPLHD